MALSSPAIRTAVGTYLQAFVLMAAESGARSDEVLDLRLGDIWISNELTINIPNGQARQKRVWKSTPDMQLLSPDASSLLAGALGTASAESWRDLNAPYSRDSCRRGRLMYPEFGGQLSKVRRKSARRLGLAITLRLRRLKANPPAGARDSAARRGHHPGQATWAAPPTIYSSPCATGTAFAQWLEGQTIGFWISRSVCQQLAESGHFPGGGLQDLAEANPAVVIAGPGRATLITLGEAIQLLRNRMVQAQALTYQRWRGAI